MNKQHTVLAILGILVFAIAGYVAFTFFTKDEQSTMGNNHASILLYVESGDVSFKNSDQGSFTHASTSPIVLSNNSHVHTGIGKAAILFPDNSSVTLDQYTELEVNYIDKHLTLIQTLGTTYNRVQALVTGASYEVETPGTLAAVRGTKFAVSYDKKTKTAKIAVTEHTVAVSRRDVNGTTTQETFISEGKLAKINEEANLSTAIAVTDTEADAEMRSWIEANIERDNDIDFFMQNGSENVRESLETLFESDRKRTESGEVTETVNADDTAARTSDSGSGTTAPTTTKREPSTATPKTTTSSSSTATGTPAASSTTIKKLDEETFFDRFNALFIAYFYLDEKDTPCTFSVTPASRVRIVTSFASESGYPFTSNTLLDFASEIDTYCNKKNPADKKRLQNRFDVEFPFQEDI